MCCIFWNIWCTAVFSLVFIFLSSLFSIFYFAISVFSLSFSLTLCLPFLNIYIYIYIYIFIYLSFLLLEREGPKFWHFFSCEGAPQFLKKRFLPQKEANEELWGSPGRQLRGNPKTGAVTEDSLAAVEVPGLLHSSWNASPRRTGDWGVIFETFSEGPLRKVRAPSGLLSWKP